MNPTQTDDKTTSVLKAAWLIAVVIVFSKLLGFVRDVVIANFYGASTVSDAYFFAYQIPALAVTLLGGVGGPFHSATVAVFSKIIPSLKEKPDEVVNKLFNTFLTTTFLAFTIFAILLFVFAQQIMTIIISGDNFDVIALAAMHLKIMSPVLIAGGIVGIYYGVLISYKEFILPNLAPIVASIVIITIVCIVKTDPTGAVLAWATTFGAFAMLLLQIPKARKIGFKIKPNFDIVNNQNFKTICELLFPAALSSTIGQINVYVDMFFTSSLQEGAWTSITYANRVFQFPVGVLVTAFLVPLFPIFARLVGQKDFESIKTYFNKGVGVLLFGAIPIIIGILTVGQDGVRLLFERGAFNDSATFMVTQALWFLSFSILPYVFRDSITRVYYSFNDSATPFLVAFTSIVLKVVFNMLLVERMGIGGITLSTSLVTLFNATILGILISRKIKLNYRELFKNFGKMAVAGIISGALCWWCAMMFDNVMLPKYLFEATKILLIAIVCLVSYVGLNLAFRMDYALELQDRLVEKIKKKLS